MSDPWLKFTRYYGEHGFAATMARIGTQCARAVFQPGYVVYRADLTDLAPGENRADVVRRTTETELEPDEAERLSQDKVETLVRAARRRRFERGAVLWLLKVDARIAGFVWSIRQSPVEPYFLSLSDAEAHLFDNEILPEYRRRGHNPGLIRFVLDQLKQDGVARAYLETRTWNKREMNSLSRTPFQPVAIARWSRVRHVPVVRWLDAGGKAPSALRGVQDEVH